MPQTVQTGHLEPGSTDLLEALRCPEAVVQFHSLKPSDTKSTVIPWRLKLSMIEKDAAEQLAHTGGLAEAAQSASVQALSDATSLATLERQEPGKGQGLQTETSMTAFFRAMQQTWNRSDLRRSLTTKVFENYGNVLRQCLRHQFAVDFVGEPDLVLVRLGFELPCIAATVEF